MPNRRGAINSMKNKPMTNQATREIRILTTEKSLGLVKVGRRKALMTVSS